MIGKNFETHYDVMRRNGIKRRDFLKYCLMTAAALGLPATMAPRIAQALESKPRLPVIWIEGLSCSCCTESFIRSAHPLAKDIVLNMISLDYNNVLMVASGQQAEEAFLDAINTNKGNYILAVEGNAPFGNEGMFCIDAGRPWLDKLLTGAENAKAVVAWGTCACWGCIQAARPNPTSVKPIADIIKNKPIVKIPGCPPIPDVMSALVTYILAFDRLPELDSQGRFAAFYGQHVHDQCVRRSHFDAGEFVEAWDDEGYKKGYCLYKMGCRGPTTFNACPNTRWNDGVSYPIESGHPCLGCSEQGYFDNGSFYSRIDGVPLLGTMETAQNVAAATVGVIGGAVALHAAASVAFHLHEKRQEEAAVDTEKAILEEQQRFVEQERKKQ